MAYPKSQTWFEFDWHHPLRSKDKEFSNILDELKSNFRPPKALQSIERVEPDSYDKLLKELIFDRKAVATERAFAGFHGVRWFRALPFSPKIHWREPLMVCDFTCFLPTSLE